MLQKPSRYKYHFMKSILKFLTVAFVAVAFSACNKVDDLPLYGAGNSGALSASSLTIAPVVADSNKTALTLNWTLPTHSIAANKIKYIIEIDSTGRNFSKAYSKTITDSLSTSFLAKELNAILLGFGFAYDRAYNMDVRVISSYPNNNERLASNTLVINIKTYKIPPKVVPPTSNKLFLVGSASASGWNNPVAASQQFTRVDSVTYQGTFYMNGGKQYVLLPVNGLWDFKYNVADGQVAGLANGGSFGANLGNDNIPGPVATGTYTIKVDFQRGLFTVTKVKQYGLLYVPGDYQGWTPATAPTLGSPNDDGKFEGYVNIPAGGSYKFKFTTGPDWTNALGDAGSGTLSASGGDIVVPGEGYYRLLANTVDKTWSASKTTWGIIGGFSPSNWGSDVPMTYSATDNKWTATITTVAGSAFKFRANSSWSLNYGDNGGGSLTENGGDIGDASKNLAIPPGTHKISLFLNNSGYYTYIIE